jgi:putative spermidine/putrescine transport system ATP-binding protein
LDLSTQYDLEVEGIYHSFSGNTLVLQGVCLQVQPGQIVCVLGPSGCGKSTLLRIIAGLVKPTKGTIKIRGQDQAGIPTHMRDLGFVFQNPALFPHLDVFDNVSFPFTQGRRIYASGDWRDGVARILHLTGLQSHQHFSVAHLSGGQVQRVALARALVYRPRLLLLDEPLSSLDNVLKRQLLDLLRKLHEEFGTTFIYVTHDEREAVSLASHVAVIDRNHVLQQFASVSEVISRPSSRAVAEIMAGWNFLQARVRGC